MSFCQTEIEDYCVAVSHIITVIYGMYPFYLISVDSKNLFIMRLFFLSEIGHRSGFKNVIIDTQKNVICEKPTKATNIQRRQT